MSVKVRNTRYRRFKAQVLGLAVGLLLIMIVGPLRAGEASETVSMTLAIVFTFVPLAFGPRWFGLLQAQPWLEADETGLTYGSLDTISWSTIKGATVKKRAFGSQVDALYAPRWEPTGMFQALARWRGLPLSEIDRDWRRNQSFVHELQRHLPDAAAQALFAA